MTVADDALIAQWRAEREDEATTFARWVVQRINERVEARSEEKRGTWAPAVDIIVVPDLRPYKLVPNGAPLNMSTYALVETMDLSKPAQEMRRVTDLAVLFGLQTLYGCGRQAQQDPGVRRAGIPLVYGLLSDRCAPVVIARNSDAQDDVDPDGSLDLLALRFRLDVGVERRSAMLGFSDPTPDLT